MSIGLNIDAILNKTWGDYKPGSKTNTTNQNTTITDENIFAKAAELVQQYHAEQSEKKQSFSGSNGFLGLSTSQIANMSTKDFLNYAYNNKSESGFKSTSTDSSGIKLPMLVRYKGEVVCTAGKTFMSVVAKLKAKYPHRSEEEIAAELMSKYGTGETENTDGSNKKSSGNTLNLSA